MVKAVLESYDDSKPILGSAVGGLRFELVPNAPLQGKTFEELEEPFATLSHAGNFSKVLLARIAMGDDSTVRYFALKLQRSDYPTSTSRNAKTNSQINKFWERERANLSSFTGGSEEVVEMFDLGAAGANQNGTAVNKPVTFCKKIRRYFHPLCPVCFTFLRDCTDESLLVRNGLPSYDKSSVRYLYCPQCATTTHPSEISFYSYSPASEELPDAKARLRWRAELYRDWAQIFRQRHSPEAEQRLSHVFPCFACPHQAACYPPNLASDHPIPAETLLHPVSYYEFRALPLELLHLHYDDFCDLLGGASWNEFKEAHWGGGVPSAQNLILSQFDALLSSSYQFIYERDPSGLFPLEVLRLKLIAFTQLCRGVRAIHAKCRQPHLDIHPSSVMALLPASGRDLPARWSFGIKVLDPAATAPFESRDGIPNFYRGIFLPPYEYHRFYTATVIKETPFGHQENVNVTLRSLEKNSDKDGKIRARVEADLIAEEVRPAELCEQDLLHVVLSAPGYGLGNLNLWGGKAAAINRGIRFKGTSAALSEETYAALERMTGHAFPRCRLAFYKTYHVPCDVYSLGMMLLRTLLVNDEADFAHVHDTVNRVINRLSLSVFEAENRAENLKQLLKNADRVFAKNAVLYRRVDRDQTRNAIPDDLWHDLLLFAFQLITSFPGFSLCANHGDYDLSQPEATLDKMLQALENFNSSLHAELFGSRERNREIQEACDELMTELANL